MTNDPNERHRRAQKRYRDLTPEYRERDNERRAAIKESDYDNREFIGWDTEGDNTIRAPFLFGNSKGGRIAAPELSTLDMLNLIVETGEEYPKSIHIGFGFDYDVNMILKDLPVSHLDKLKQFGETQWHGYVIHHMPRKWFVVSRKEPRVSVKIFDIVSFFHCRYVKALEDFKVGTPEQQRIIAEGKEGRQAFSFADLSYIEKYWRTELDVMPLLGNTLRDSFYGAGFKIRSWHGPGALASYLLKYHRVADAMNTCPKVVHEAARYAFAGGRFESFKAGLYEGEVYNADINSAYPYALQFLPDLSKGEWKHVSKVDKESILRFGFAVYHIQYFGNSYRRVPHKPQPLFRRYSDDRVVFPHRVEGWYWAPEAWQVRGDDKAHFVEAYVFHGDGTFPFREFVPEIYRRRLELQSTGNPIQLGYKLALNSVFGQLAQRAGWERKKRAPQHHQIEWAGFLTSVCRSMIYTAAMVAYEKDELISIDTDGIFCTGPIPESSLLNGCGDSLGQWKVSTLSGILYWQSGVYWIRDTDGNWISKKARGASRSEKDEETGKNTGGIPVEPALKALGTMSELVRVPGMKPPSITYTKPLFMGYRAALQRTDGYSQQWRYFVDQETRLAFGGSFESKRAHPLTPFTMSCRTCFGIDVPVDGMHDLCSTTSFDPNRHFGDMRNHSHMHYLPWEENDHRKDSRFDTETLDRDTEWLDEIAI